VVRSSFVYQRKSALILPEIHQRDWLLQSLPVSFGFHRKSTVDPVTRIQKILHKSNPRITIQTQNRGKILHKSNNPSQSKPNTNTKCKSNLRISLTKKKNQTSIRWFGREWCRGGRRGGEKEGGRENRPEIHVFRLDLSLYSDKDPAGRGFQPDPAGYLTFRFRSDLSNVTDSGRVQIPSSRSHRPSQSLAREKRRRTRGRGRDEVRLEREIFFLSPNVRGSVRILIK
jgi:hypothetical protein